MRFAKLPAYNFQRSIEFAVLMLIAISSAAQISPTAPALLNTNGDMDSGGDLGAHLATDNAGNWVAVWHSNHNLNGAGSSDFDIFYARSTDNGVTWTSPELLNSNATTDSGLDQSARVATDGDGTWIAVWWSEENLNGIAGTDADILYAISTNNGATWTPPNLLYIGAEVDAGDDKFPDIATDGGDNWVVAWDSNENLAGAGANETDIFVATSSNDGASWLGPELLNSFADSDGGDDSGAELATDQNGNWICVWRSSADFNGADTDSDQFYARSTDNGGSWSPPGFINTIAANESATDTAADVATDGNGNWIAVWMSDLDLNGAGTDFDIFVTRSNDAGLSWSAPELVYNNGAFDSGPEIAYDGFGNAVLTWFSTEDLNGTAGTDQDIFGSNSSDHGVTWSPATLMNTSGTSDDPNTGSDSSPTIFADNLGNWIVAWHSSADINGTAGTDNDVFTARFMLGATTSALEGYVAESGSLAPIACAAVVATNANSSFVGVTDLNGSYRIPKLTPGVYTLTAHAPGFATESVVRTIAATTDHTAHFRLETRGAAGLVRGTFVDQDSNLPLPGVRVEASIANEVVDVVYTCADGLYEVDISQPKGTVQVDLEYSLENYDTENESVQADPAVTTDVPPVAMGSQLIPVATLTGVVTTAGTANPIENARVTIVGPSNGSVDTGNDGVYLFTLPEGNYQIEASAENHTGLQTNQNVTTPNINQWDAPLQPGAPELDFRDVNLDGVLDAVDIQNVINAALGLFTPLDADVNGDGTTNAVDVQLVINGVLEN